MSGGHFDYKQYYIDEIADSIERELNRQDKENPEDEQCNNEEHRYFDEPEETCSRVYSEIVQEKMREAVRQLKIAAVYAQRVDWLLSGEDDEEDFLKRLQDDLNQCRK